ncbi:hypothetical protein ALC53_09845 [Atta colombica]|uniref:Uncharacterized protein n=1 Tax=Atta colombica TaxID=520822 RepID=A0A195B5E7_9HYME|nr:hypothetical protein ALC53_09845 [Atta colombica]
MEDRDIPNRTIEDQMDVSSRMRGEQVHVASLRLGVSSHMKRSTRWSGLKKSARWIKYPKTGAVRKGGHVPPVTNRSAVRKGRGSPSWISVSGVRRSQENAALRGDAILADSDDRMLTARSGPLGLGVPRTLGPAEGSDHLFLLPERALGMDSTHLRQDLAGLDFNLHLNLLHTAPRGNVWLCELLNGIDLCDKRGSTVNEDILAHEDFIKKSWLYLSHITLTLSPRTLDSTVKIYEIIQDVFSRLILRSRLMGCDLDAVCDKRRKCVTNFEEKHSPIKIPDIFIAYVAIYRLITWTVVENEKTHISGELFHKNFGLADFLFIRQILIGKGHPEIHRLSVPVCEGLFSTSERIHFESQKVGNVDDRKSESASEFCYWSRNSKTSIISLTCLLIDDVLFKMKIYGHRNNGRYYYWIPFSTNSLECEWIFHLLKNIPLNIRGNSWFQLDDCTTYYGKDPRQWLNFSQKMDRAGSMAFADLTSLDFFIWDILKHTKSICLINDLQSLKQRIVRACEEITFSNFISQYFLNEAFASILPEKNFVCFEVLNSYLKFGHLIQEQPVELKTDYQNYSFHYRARNACKASRSRSGLQDRSHIDLINLCALCYIASTDLELGISFLPSPLLSWMISAEWAISSMFLIYPRYLERFQSSLRSHALYFPAIAMVLGASVRANRVDGLARRYTRRLFQAYLRYSNFSRGDVCLSVKSPVNREHQVRVVRAAECFVVSSALLCAPCGMQRGLLATKPSCRTRIARVSSRDIAPTVSTCVDTDGEDPDDMGTGKMNREIPSSTLATLRGILVSSLSRENLGPHDLPVHEHTRHRSARKVHFHEGKLEVETILR